MSTQPNQPHQPDQKPNQPGQQPGKDDQGQKLITRGPRPPFLQGIIMPLAYIKVIEGHPDNSLPGGGHADNGLPPLPGAPDNTLPKPPPGI